MLNLRETQKYNQNCVNLEHEKNVIIFYLLPSADIF